MSWASGLGSSPGEKAVKGNGDIIAFHCGVPKGALQNKVFRWSSRPRGKGHLPALVTKKSFFSLLSVEFPGQLIFPVPFYFFTYLSPGLGEVPAFLPIKWVLSPNLLIFYYCHEYQGSWRYCENSIEGRKETAEIFLHSMASHAISTAFKGQTLLRSHSHCRTLAYISSFNSCHSPLCSLCSSINGLLSGPGHTESILPYAVSISSTWLHEPYIFLCNLSFLMVLSQLLMAMGKEVTSHYGIRNKRYWVANKKEGEL